MKFQERYGPWAAIAGATEGIGRSYAEALAQRGIHLIMLARRGELLEREAAVLRGRHKVEVRTASLDLASPDLLAQFRDATSGLDLGLLVYNAAASSVTPFVETSLEQEHRVLDVNCRGLVTLAREVAPALVQRGRGGIIVMTSMASFQGAPLIATYAASKAFDLVFAEGLWSELTPHGVDVLACVAGATYTPAFEAMTPADRRKKAYPMHPDQVAQEGLAALGLRPVHITGRVNRLVNAVLRLLSRRARAKFFAGAMRDIYGNVG